MKLPTLPVKLNEFIPYLKEHSKIPVADLLDPFKVYEGRLREIFAQEADNPVLSDPFVNVLPLFEGHETDLKIRARDLEKESKEQQDKYLFSLCKDVRKSDGVPAITTSLKDFKKNFSIFSESSLADMNWNNVVAAGSSVVTSLLPIPEKYATSKRTQRDFYHEILAPSSDVDLFLYGLNEDEAIEKIRQIETCIRDSILSETTTIRTRNAITICSQYPTRHVQIVLRLYKNVSEILTGFDIDCSCVAFDGSQVYASPRAIAAYVTQINMIDLTRRSPSYENRLSKYSHRGFEVYWPSLERSRIDPTVFERSFARVVGLARLLVLEKLPTPTARDEYLENRRSERGRPPAYDRYRFARHLPGNKKDQQPDDVAEWVEEDEVSNYHTFTVPYGPKYHAKKIEQLLYKKDLLLNAEWNRPKDRETELHRHPCFFGRVDDVIHDCCGYCPKPIDEEDEKLAFEEGKIYVSGDIEFIKDNPGRQAIGSFHPLNDDDWTEMAYVGNTTILCQAIVDGDFEHVLAWCEEEGNNVNRRDYTGRTPLHLATLCSTPEIVQCLVDHGARMIWRLVDGFTTLHIAAWRGNAAMVRILLEKSEENEETEAKREDKRKAAKKDKPSEASAHQEESDQDEDEDDEDIADMSDSDESQTMTEGSYVRVKEQMPEGDTMPDDIIIDDPDIFDVNILAWDSPLSPLHCAILGGHIEVIELLVDKFGADIFLPVKLINRYNRNPQAAILTLVLALALPSDQCNAVSKKLLDLGASPSQADMDQVTALHHAAKNGNSEVLDLLFELDAPAAKNAINHLSVSGHQYHAEFSTPLITAMRVQNSTMVKKLLALGAEPSISCESFTRSWQRKFDVSISSNPEEIEKAYGKKVEQPIIVAIQCEMPEIALKFLSLGVDPNTMTKMSHERLAYPSPGSTGETVLDLVRNKLKQLRSYKGENVKNSEHPGSLQSDPYYLESRPKGSYQEWAAMRDLEQVKNVHLKVMEDWIAGTPESERDGLGKKKEAIATLIAELETLEKELVKLGAGTFDALHTSAKNAPPANWGNYKPTPNKPFNIEYSFLVSDWNELKRGRYLQLFEAAWEGDMQTVKSLTLGNGGESGSSPLRIAVQDQRGFSPYSIAVYRGHRDMAKAIIDIAAAQYHPVDDGNKHLRFHLGSNTHGEYSGDDEISTDDENDDRVYIFSELIDENFTVEDIGAVGDTVQSDVTPLKMIQWSAEFWRCTGLPESEANKELDCDIFTSVPHQFWGGYQKGARDVFQRLYYNRGQRDRCSIIRYAIYKNDKELLKFLLESEISCIAQMSADDDDTNTLKMQIVGKSDFNFTIGLNRTSALQEIISRTGHGIPVQRLIKKSGIEVQERPKYYQGLSVYGSKRKDWATAGRHQTEVFAEDELNPLLLATFQGSMESFEWFFSDAPLRKYKEYIRKNQENEHLKKLVEAEGGLEKSIGSWLHPRQHLVLHAAVMAVSLNGEDSVERMNYVLSRDPLAVDKRSINGFTPLLLALSLRRIPAARSLVEAGANQTLRDQMNCNALHHILRPPMGPIAAPSVMELKTMLNLIDKRLLKSLFLERSTHEPTSLTPVAWWLHGDFSRYIDASVREPPAIFDMILDYAGNEVLDVMDGAGDYPIHTIVKKGYASLAAVVIRRKPSMLFRENAVGATALELCQTQHLRRYLDSPPNLIALSNHQRIPQPTEQRPLTYFAPNPFEPLSDHEETFRICTHVAVEKRKLVSLFDANAVAKRLASRKTPRIGLTGEKESATDRRNPDGDDAMIEISGWYSNAASKPVWKET